MEPRKPPERLPEKPRRGLVLVITGDGKGKTTSCLGMAVRAVGYGMKVLMVQFIKQWGYPGIAELVSGAPRAIAVAGTRTP